MRQPFEKGRVLVRIEIARDYEALSERAARLIADEIEARERIVLGLATGSTPLGVYRRWIEWVRAEQLSFAGVSTFNLDEYVGLAPDHPQSYWSFMQEKLFRQIDIRPSNVHIPQGNAEDVQAHCAEYERQIRAAGGIDIQILGIGGNGHIGFNEPGAEFGGSTHLVALAESTRRANARFFKKEEDVPTHAVTMGLKSIMNARQILLLASGRGKSEAVARAVYGDVTPDHPASILQLHPNCVFLLDEEAALGVTEGERTR